MFSEGRKRGECTNHIRKRLKLGDDKETATTLTTPGKVGTAIGRYIWSKILGKTSVEKLINKGGCENRSYTTVSIGI